MHGKLDPPSLDAVLGSASAIANGRLAGEGPAGKLPLTPDMLREEPSGNLFGLTQNVGMGWSPDALDGPQYVIVSTHGGMRREDGSPVALGYHTGHWEIGLLVRAAAETLRAAGAIPFAAYCSDPCDGRTQGTTGMFDSLPYRNDAAIVMRRLIRSLPTASGVIGVATCDKGLPATMLALAGCRDLPGVVVPGGVTLPARGGEDAGQVQSLGARFARDLVSLDYAATMGCRACGSAGGGCQFLGTAATSQVVAEAFGLALPHSALAPSGEPVWLELGQRSALALLRLDALGPTLQGIPTQHAPADAMLGHAAFRGATQPLLRISAGSRPARGGARGAHRRCRGRSRRRDHGPRRRAPRRHDQQRSVSGWEPGPRGCGDQSHRDRPFSSGRRSGVSPPRPRARVRGRARRDPGREGGRYRPADPGRRRDRADRQRAVRHGDAGDGADHHRAQVPPLGETRRAPYRRPLFGVLEWCLCGTHRPGGATREPRKAAVGKERSEEHTSELQSPCNLVCRLLLEKKKNQRLQTL